MNIRIELNQEINIITQTQDEKRVWLKNLATQLENSNKSLTSEMSWAEHRPKEEVEDLDQINKEYEFSKNKATIKQTKHPSKEYKENVEYH